MVSTEKKTIAATLHPSGFTLADSNFYSLTLGSDDALYYTLCSHDIETHARVYRYDPGRDEVRCLVDFGEATGEVGQKTLPQGKSHTPFYEHDGKLYVATHYGYFKASAGKEEPAEVPEGYKQYPGGHFLEIDMATGATRVLATAPKAEGFLTMALDAERGRMYGLTWPKGLLMYLDMATGELHNLGPVSRDGEVGRGDRYFCLCRTFAVLPKTGDVYFTNADGEVMCYDYTTDSVQSVDWAHMRRDIFGCWDPHQPGHQGYNWRPCRWHPEHGLFYGVHPKSGFLFRFDPQNRKHEIIDRICSERVRKSGEFEAFRYGYLTLDFAPGDPETIYYISGYDVSAGEQAKRADGLASGADAGTGERLSFVTYHLPTGRFVDHGELHLEDGRRLTNAQSIAAHPNGRIYTCPWIEKPHWKQGDGPSQQCDLVSFAVPETER